MTETAACQASDGSARSARLAMPSQLIELPTLLVRLDAFPLSVDFSRNRLLSVGMPLDGRGLQLIAGEILFDDDLGPLGVIAIAGIAWQHSAAVPGSNSVAKLLCAGDTCSRAAADTGLYLLLYTSISPTILFADGTSILSRVMAMRAGMFTPRSKREKYMSRQSNRLMPPEVWSATQRGLTQ